MVWQLLTWPAQSLLWLAGQIQERAEAQLDNKENLQKELTALQIQLDLGEIDEDTYTQREEEILLALEALAQAEQEATAEDVEDDQPERDP
ncbi:MAG: gas vesicle protein GvpG [Thermostichus sp. HHBFW_bins_43]